MIPSALDFAIPHYVDRHDKVIIADRETVEMVSYNYWDAAAHKNSENVLVNGRNPELAKVYMKHFERNYRQAKAFELPY